jgi:hypothetical protein
MCRAADQAVDDLRRHVEAPIWLVIRDDGVPGNGIVPWDSPTRAMIGWLTEDLCI